MDEPSNSELAGRLDGITVMLQQVVGRPEYNADERFREHRFTEIERDHTEFRRVFNETVKTLTDRIEEHAKDHKQQEQRRGADWRQFAYAGIAPFAIGILLAIVTTWINKGGK